ncbi:hypothetical protein PUNSTDRAFT_113335 [Punctularia strigosozonata HHB-11173 SS5]|uniref:uncharacterized protein n=1 Tax=Punctularia strigosozonata (strain HHB-11173) TaxID=741275 RepID=UPI00044176C1|nr:uncharacterized protein PUNSTDRAFT_113335 [Punctularia strigosozonata HHB-11173 SS5]EIN10070.1 hypothetical protein PUNSTDRAFT_113335 [Punctularia strigosozonata HHB-11173 SS5]
MFDSTPSSSRMAGRPRPSVLDLFDPLADNDSPGSQPTSPDLETAAARRSPSPDGSSSDKENDTPAPSRTYQLALKSPRRPSPKAAARLVDVSILLEALRSDVAEESSDGEFDTGAEENASADVLGASGDDAGLPTPLKIRRRLPLADISLGLEQPEAVALAVGADRDLSFHRDARLASSVSRHPHPNPRSFPMASSSLAFSASPGPVNVLATSPYGSSHSPFSSPERNASTASCSSHGYGTGSPTRAPASSPLSSVINAINFSTAHSPSPLSNSHSVSQSPYPAVRPSPLKRAISLPRSEDSDHDEHGFLRQDSDDGDALPTHYSEFDLDEVVEEPVDENRAMAESPIEMQVKIPQADEQVELEEAPPTARHAPADGADKVGKTPDVFAPEDQNLDVGEDENENVRPEDQPLAGKAEAVRNDESSVGNPELVSASPSGYKDDHLASPTEAECVGTSRLDPIPASDTSTSLLSVPGAPVGQDDTQDLTSTLAFGSSTAELLPSSNSALLLNDSSLHDADDGSTMDYTRVLSSLPRPSLREESIAEDEEREQPIVVRAPTPPVLNPSPPPKFTRGRDSLVPAGRASLDSHASFNLSSQLQRTADTSFDLLHGGMTQSFLKQMEDEEGDMDLTFDLGREQRAMEGALKDAKEAEKVEEKGAVSPGEEVPKSPDSPEEALATTPSTPTMIDQDGMDRSSSVATLAPEAEIPAEEVAVKEQVQVQEETPVPLTSVIAPEVQAKALAKASVARRPSVSTSRTTKPEDSKPVVKARPSISAPAPAAKPRVGTARKSFVPPSITALKVAKRSTNGPMPKEDAAKSAADKRTGVAASTASSARRMSAVPAMASHQRTASTVSASRRTSAIPPVAPHAHQRAASVVGETRRASVVPLGAAAKQAKPPVPSPPGPFKAAVAPLKVNKLIPTATAPTKDATHLGLKQGTAVFSRPAESGPSKPEDAKKDVSRLSSAPASSVARDPKVAVKTAATSRLAKPSTGLGVGSRPAATGIARSVSASSVGRVASGSGRVVTGAVKRNVSSSARVGGIMPESRASAGPGVKVRTGVAPKPVSKT